MGVLAWFSAAFLPVSPRMRNRIGQNEGRRLRPNQSLGAYLIDSTRFLHTNGYPLSPNSLLFQ